MPDADLIIWYIRSNAVNFACRRAAVQYWFEANILSWEIPND